MERTSYDTRHDATDYTGTTQWIWGIGAAVYLSLMGADGMAELGRGIMQRARHAAERIADLPGVAVPHLAATLLQGVQGRLLRHRQERRRHQQRRCSQAEIHGGKDLSGEFPALGQSALYCVTELHGAAEIERLVAALGEALR